MAFSGAATALNLVVDDFIRFHKEFCPTIAAATPKEKTSPLCVCRCNCRYLSGTESRNILLLPSFVYRVLSDRISIQHILLQRNLVLSTVNTAATDRFSRLQAGLTSLDGISATANTVPSVLAISLAGIFQHRQ